MMPKDAHTMARRWFARCDLVKYAAERPERDRSDLDLSGARDVILATVQPTGVEARG
jgi:hypothetical protein